MRTSISRWTRSPITGRRRRAMRCTWGCRWSAWRGAGAGGAEEFVGGDERVDPVTAFSGGLRSGGGVRTGAGVWARVRSSDAARLRPVAEEAAADRLRLTRFPSARGSVVFRAAAGD